MHMDSWSLLHRCFATGLPALARPKNRIVNKAESNWNGCYVSTTGLGRSARRIWLIFHMR